MKNLFKLFLSTLLLISCNSNERVSRDVFEEVNKSMEVKKLNEADIIQAAMVWGEEISNEAQKQLITALQEAIADEGVPAAIRYCNVNALPILQEVSEKYNVEIKRVSNDYRNPADKPLEYEEGILDTYVYNGENDIANEPSIQKIEGGEVLLFTKAIMIPNALCLNCHGQEGKEISPETQNVLDELYPEDKAKGHKIGDLRGMWSIRLPKKEVVKNM
ncbi:DUF3365 domain-containing protein [Aquiflexum sp.]|uniref:Tll0287-like domain-containing protein n=1 Tax=Aquiflexum sp. TaxID=1872584 RepID=UPI0035946886